MIIDSCIFAGEMEMLLFRKAILDPVVDHYVVVENAWTHQREPRLQTLSDSHFFNYLFDNPTEIEQKQRDAIAKCCWKFKDSDIIILSDIDEIPSRESVLAVKKQSLPRTCELDFYYYRLNHRRKEKCGLIISTVGHLRELGGNGLRDRRGTAPPIGVKPSGWHLSYFGGTEAIQKKLSSFCHAEFNKPEFTDKEWLEECQREGKGLLKCGTQCSPATPEDFPQYFLDAAPTDWWL